MPCVNNLVFLVLKPVPIPVIASLLSRLLMWWSILLSSCFAKEDIISGLDVVQGHRLGALLCQAPEQNNDYRYQLQSKTVELLFIWCSWSSGQPYIIKYIANVMFVEEKLINGFGKENVPLVTVRSYVILMKSHLSALSGGCFGETAFLLT